MNCLFNGCSKPVVPSLDKCAFHRYRSKCKVDGCFNQVYARLLCVSHGGKKTCQSPGCASPVRIGDFCTKHTTRSSITCSVDGCTQDTAAANQTTCPLHGGSSNCAVDDCVKPARMGKFCWHHRNRVLSKPMPQDALPCNDGDALILMLDEWMMDESLASSLADDFIDFDGILDDIISF
ncbi:hypothetical protein SPRG_10111 [Saprolegnia parasitica CBS 223.65]|uniref:Uncharacterized protein n=1 Tax=Saprolegnia parasitica (strain CBS 223.65) TaxID=695850 RepID=A0A067C5Z2_SAPPC|nr:hypothetical protein SPRG_10111 [Saprolegnia parasitica CBS 223.65]KDO24580.1 hypothetical protein SPRG_10111 [Saprolegnia parasitica CBS 223.65]|eukprot:XP_012204648.1 hypothetical protein SPRG_10111 [Saprolegnia parasitica CBS 223.65]